MTAALHSTVALCLSISKFIAALFPSGNERLWSSDYVSIQFNSKKRPRKCKMPSIKSFFVIAIVVAQAFPFGLVLPLDSRTSVNADSPNRFMFY